MKCKRIISIIMAALCLLTMSGAFAYKVGEARVAIGANLDSEQIAAVYSDFGIERGVIRFQHSHIQGVQLSAA